MIAEYDALRFIFAPYNVSLTAALERPAYIKEHFAQVSAVLGYQMLPPERMVDLLGHVVLGRDTAQALELFQMNAELYPNSAKVYDALGDGWMAKGDFTKASSFYERSLALKPGNKHAKDMIKKMRESKP
jgi:tetratricopeptide (TPR) repeat protein